MTPLQGTILITGGTGFLGARLARHILETRPGCELLLTDIQGSPRLDALRNGPHGDRIRYVEADLSRPDAFSGLVDRQIRAVYHLASLVSGGAEKDFEAGMKANIHATINLLEACRTRADRPRLVFASSIATFGGSALPETVDDWTFQHPQNSYGVAKVVGEQLLNDYSRKGFIDGRGIRLPAIAVRDVPNSAASGYVSNMVREALQGGDYDCPVPPDTRIPVMAAEDAVELLLVLGELKAERLGDYRTINGQGISPSAGEIAHAVGRLAPEGRPAGRIRFRPDPAIESIIRSWPKEMKAERSRSLGLPATLSVDRLVFGYVQTLER